MLGRALSLAAAGLVGCLVATAGWAQNLDAGKSPAQLFNGSCSACHKSARGLLRTVPPSSLPGFLRQHYTTGTDMAQALSGYLISNGAAAAEPRGGKRSRQDSGNLRPDAPIGGSASDERGREQAERSERKPRAANPAAAQPEEAVQAGGRKQRHRRPEAAPVEGSAPDVAGSEAPAGTKGKQKLSRKKKGEPAKDEAKTEPKTEPRAEPKSEPKAAEPATPAPAEAVAKPEAKPESKPTAPALNEKAIDAGVPMPEPADVPPPTAADIKAETPAAEKAPAASAPEAAPKATDKPADTEAKPATQQ